MAATRKPNRGSFGTGNRANPAGRPAMPAEVREALRALSPQAVRTLAEIMSNGENESNRLRAAETILDRAWGKAPAAPEDHASEQAAGRPFAGLTAEVLLTALRDARRSRD